MSTRLHINGRPHDVPDDPATPLVFALRGSCGLASVRHGCGLEQCGACKVLCNGEPVHACVRPLGEFAGCAIITVEGLSEQAAVDANGSHLRALNRLQAQFLAHNAAQCGFCLSGVLMTSTALLEASTRPTDAQVLGALDDHLCRCGAQPRMLRAIRAALDERFGT